VSITTGKAPISGVIQPPSTPTSEATRWKSSVEGAAMTAPWPKALATRTGCADTGSGGMSGSVARKAAPAGAAAAPAAPYSGTARSGTSSTYWYSSVQPEAAVTAAPS
jgi:hypothetical protein